MSNPEDHQSRNENDAAHSDNETGTTVDVPPTTSPKSRPRAPSSGPSSRPVMIGNYHIIREMGAGGMGVVYEAEQQHPKRLVALKVIKGGRFVDEQQIRLFEREAQALARLKHRSAVDETQDPGPGKSIGGLIPEQYRHAPHASEELRRGG